jgi:hypothetical protein
MSEIERLKREARRLNRLIEANLDSVDCGISMLCFFRPSVGRYVTEFDACIARLREIDPSFPKKETP